jgi:hypothetical protein
MAGKMRKRRKGSRENKRIQNTKGDGYEDHYVWALAP